MHLFMYVCIVKYMQLREAMIAAACIHELELPPEYIHEAVCTDYRMHLAPLEYIQPAR